MKDDGISYVIEEELITKYGGFSVDYSTNWLSKGFRIQPSYGGSSC